MNLRRILMYLFLGFSIGVVIMSATDKLLSRTGNWGGEILCVPCMALLVWFGYSLRGDFEQLKTNCRRKRHEKRSH